MSQAAESKEREKRVFKGRPSGTECELEEVQLQRIFPSLKFVTLCSWDWVAEVLKGVEGGKMREFFRSAVVFTFFFPRK